MTITPYATYTDFTRVYSVSAFNVSQAEVESAWLPHGAVAVNEKLGNCFTLPFSSNNASARDLNVHYAYLGILERTRNQEDSLELRNSLQDRISDICSGNSPMALDDGTALFPDGSTKFEVWSNTQEYKQTFDMRNPLYQRVDPDRIDDEWDADI